MPSINRYGYWGPTFITPSLRAKKYKGANNLWQARVNRDWRFYFMIVSGLYTIVAIVAHPK